VGDSPQKISRRELYERIWSTPTVKLGKELGYGCPIGRTMPLGAGERIAKMPKARMAINFFISVRIGLTIQS